jgi:hypothetical protein
MGLPRAGTRWDGFRSVARYFPASCRFDGWFDKFTEITPRERCDRLARSQR